MTEPVLASNIMLSAMAGAMMILFGAFYAFFFAFSRLKNNHRHLLLAYASYGVFAAFTLVLMHTLNLEGYWRILTFLLLVGYLLAPHGIWHLCVGTHKHKTGEKAASRKPDTPSPINAGERP